MLPHSYSGLSATSFVPEAEPELSPGDLVCTGFNVAAHHQVIAVYGDKAWVRDVRDGRDGITSLSRCHKVELPAAH